MLARNMLERVTAVRYGPFDRDHWLGQVMVRCMENAPFKERMFRFIDVLPRLNSASAVQEHFHDYLGEEGEQLPPTLRLGARSARLAGPLLAPLVRRAIRQMAHQFIAGEEAGQVVAEVTRLRGEGHAATVALVGEQSVGESECDLRLEEYFALLNQQNEAQDRWTPLPGEGGDPTLDWGDSPRIQLSVKPSALYSRIRPQDFDGSVEGVLKRLRPLMERAIEIGAFVCLDMESYRTKDITLEVYRRLRADEPFASYPHLGIALQAYLRDADADVDGLLRWAVRDDRPLAVRLVKGAYWDYENVVARQQGWKIPVRRDKGDTDAAFERLAIQLLQRHDICYLACGSHNVRSIAAVLTAARQLEAPSSRYEFQFLYGMADPLHRALGDDLRRVRMYCPCGELLPGMAYLIRRLLENTSNESFLRQAFVQRADIPALAAAPAPAPEPTPEPTVAPTTDISSRLASSFGNEPRADFTKESVRRQYTESIAAVRATLPLRCALYIDGRDVWTEERAASRNPARPDEAVGSVCQTDRQILESAVASARKAWPEWRRVPAAERAQMLLRAADYLRLRHADAAALQVLEVGKSWDEADADVGEAIDFLEYYARQMIRLDERHRLGRIPGEHNELFWEPRGVAAVIGPWNFPLAISVGMVSAALVTGNCVVYKPSSQSMVVGRALADMFQNAGAPAGVFHYLPGPGHAIGDALVDHPDIDLIAFTGSLEVGVRIIQRAGAIQPGQRNIKRVIVELGGKNAIIIDDDADLDEAVPAVIHSAFSYQGQKCSACSRVIVVGGIYEDFVRRLLDAAQSLRLGPPEDPSYDVGPVIDQRAQGRILEYVDVARREGSISFESPTPQEGFYAPVVIVEGVTPAHRIAQEEVFGPLLSIMKVHDFDQALEWANSTRYALTGGLFSRRPRHIRQARTRLRAGNLYINRGITGAFVERQPFGGTGLSGTGTKAGGEHYLAHFMSPRVITENTVRRGFTLDL